MSKVFVFDVSRCTGCYNCQLACKDEHCGNDWAPYAAAQPDVGQFWIKVNEMIQGTVPKVKMHYLPHMCNHCDNAPCLDVCPTGAAYRREDGLIVFDSEKCNGCKKCMEACPYEGVIYFNEESNLCQKCTGCAHLLDNGAELPRCVEACPTEALKFGEEEDLAKLIVGAQAWKVEEGTHPRVYYRNVPGKFIAGTLYDPIEEEVIIGANCRLNNGGKIYETKTDNYGDFWFKDLAEGLYDLIIEADGFELKAFYEVDATEGSVNLGDIAMEKKA